MYGFIDKNCAYINWSFQRGRAFQVRSCCFYSTVPVNSMLLLLLQVIIFFPSIQLIYTAVNSSFSVPITLPYSLGLFIPRDLVKNLRDIFLWK